MTPESIPEVFAAITQTRSFVLQLANCLSEDTICELYSQKSINRKEILRRTASTFRQAFRNKERSTDELSTTYIHTVAHVARQLNIFENATSSEPCADEFEAFVKFWYVWHYHSALEAFWARYLILFFHISPRKGRIDLASIPESCLTKDNPLVKSRIRLLYAYNQWAQSFNLLGQLTINVLIAFQPESHIEQKMAYLYQQADVLQRRLFQFAVYSEGVLLDKIEKKETSIAHFSGLVLSKISLVANLRLKRSLMSEYGTSFYKGLLSELPAAVASQGLPTTLEELYSLPRRVATEIKQMTSPPAYREVNRCAQVELSTLVDTRDFVQEFLNQESVRVRLGAAGLSPSARRTIELFILEGMSEGEISKHRNRKVGTVRSELARSKAKLQKTSENS